MKKSTAMEDAEALLQQELEQIDARLATLSTGTTKVGFDPPNRSTNRARSGPTAKSGGRATVTFGQEPAKQLPNSASRRKTEPSRDFRNGSQRCPPEATKAKVPDVPTGPPEPRRVQVEKVEKPKAKVKAAVAPKLGTSRSERQSTRQSEKSFESMAPQLAFLNVSEQTVTVSLEPMAPDLLEAEFCRALLATQNTSYLPQTLELPPADTTLRKFAAILDRIVPPSEIRLSTEAASREAEARSAEAKVKSRPMDNGKGAIRAAPNEPQKQKE